MSGSTETFPDVVAEITAGHGLNLGQAARRFPSYRESRPVNTSTVFRWLHDGVKLGDGKRLRLQGARIGGRWLTTPQAIERFIRAQTPDHDDGVSSQPRSPSPTQRTSAAERAAKELERMGV